MNGSLRNLDIGISVGTHPVTIKESVIRFQPHDIKDVMRQAKDTDPNLIGGGIGIDVGAPGVTPGESPTLVSAQRIGDTVRIQGTLHKAPYSAYYLEFFGNQVTNPADAQGEFYLGSTTVMTNGSGDASFDVNFNAVYGTHVTATFTGTAPNGYTSEFSAAVALVGGGTGNAVVAGRTWTDPDFDGSQDIGEQGLGGVAVKLYTAAGTLVATTTSLSSGAFSFANVTPGDYYLEFVATSGHVFSPSYRTDFTLDSDVDPADGRTAVFSLIAGEVNPFFGAGLAPTAGLGSVAGTVWQDDDGDGIQDVSETTGLAGLVVTLLNANGTVVASTLTAANGSYNFGYVAPGTYSLAFSKPAGLENSYAFSPWDQGGNDALDSDAWPNGRTAYFSLFAGQFKDLDAGLFPIL